MKKSSQKQKIFADFQQIPGVGKSLAQDLFDLGLRSIHDLKDVSAEELYSALCTLRKRHIDRCVLYVFRCAVYFASSEIHEPALLKWWWWKD